MTVEHKQVAPNRYRESFGRYLEDFKVGDIYEHCVWLNPVPEKYWGYSQSTQIVRQLIHERMYPLTLHGLDDAMRALSRKV